eukprot:GHUV01004561.1.p1 GENE.GHUV01004561.1~~GHUV01004561.1.p1  ORF type:complete len:467 (+),score=129.22 GHUV01004561.1:60-1460(+)
MTALDGLQLLDEAISKVHHVKSDVSNALCISPTAPGQASPAGDQLECLQRAQQQIQQLQQLAPQIQQLAASVQQPVRSVSEQRDRSDTWVDSVQQQAGQLSAILQQQVQAAVCSARLTSPLGDKQSVESFETLNAQRRALGEELLLTVLRVSADRAWLQVHLFKSSNNSLLAEMPNPGAHRRDAQRQAEHRYHMSNRFIEQAHACDEVRVMCNGVFCASIALAGPGNFQPVRVVVDSADKVSSVDPWTASKHQVFKRISYLSVRALQHFQLLADSQHLLEQPNALLTKASTREHASAVHKAKYTGQTDPTGKPPAALYALECLLWWLACYDDLFARACAVSGSLIAWEPATAIPLPPLLRPYWLSLDELRSAAGDRAHSASSGRQAYHTHLAPAPPAEAAALADLQKAVTAGLGRCGSVQHGVAEASVAGGATPQQGLDSMTDDSVLTGFGVSDEQLWVQLQETMV